MTRVYASLILIALWCATALAKPSVAVLGVEVTGEIDQAATTTARDLTEGMRSRAKIASGPYQIAPHSSRELIDEKVLHSCESEESPCMAAIGKGLNADVLVYGKLAREGSGYEAILVVLDVKKRAVVRRRTVKIPPDSNGDQVRAIAKKAYAELAGESPATGTLVVRTNVESGTLLIDDESRESFGDGEAMLQLAPGRYRVAIEADGYRRREITVRITEDDTTTETIELAQRDTRDKDDPETGGGIGFWKPAFVVSAAATLALTGVSLHAWSRVNDLEGQITNVSLDMAPATLTQGNCDRRDEVVGSGAPAFKDACAMYSRNLYTGIAAGGAFVFTVAAAYMAFFRDAPPQRREVAVTPVVSPDGAGALVRVTW